MNQVGGSMAKTIGNIFLGRFAERQVQRCSGNAMCRPYP
jgi:hypothetical protein